MLFSVYTHPDSYNWLFGSHMTQYHCGHYMLENHWGYAAATVTGTTVHAHTLKVPSTILQLTVPAIQYPQQYCVIGDQCNRSGGIWMCALMFCIKFWCTKKLQFHKSFFWTPGAVSRTTGWFGHFGEKKNQKKKKKKTLEKSGMLSPLTALSIHVERDNYNYTTSFYLYVWYFYYKRCMAQFFPNRFVILI